MQYIIIIIKLIYRAHFRGMPQMRDATNIYISCLCYDVSVRLSVTEVHWHIIANLDFKFWSKFTTHCGCGEG